jgi:hypothetical protein
MLFLIVLLNRNDGFKPLFWTHAYSSLQGDAHLILSLEISELSHVSFTYGQSDILRTPGKATFGGFWPSQDIEEVDTRLAAVAYTSFFESFPQQKELKVILPPAVFCPAVFKPQREVLLEFEPKNITMDINFHVQVEDWSVDHLSKGNRKKIRQFKESGGIVAFAGFDSIKECYEVLVENRSRRGVSLTMNYQDFENSLQSLSDDFMLICARLNMKIVATAYVVKILPDYWYVLFWGELPDYRSFSPVVSIFEFLMRQSQSNHIKILDLGISSVNGVVDEGLAKFKSNLGAISSEKMTLLLDLNPLPKT